MSTGTPVVVSRIQNRRGLQQQFDGYAYSAPGPNSLYPAGYSGIGGYNSYSTFTEANYPNVLMPGEIAFCTDSRRIFIGNINGEYTEISSNTGPSVSSSLELSPVVISLTTSPTWTPVLSSMTIPITPFFNILYSVVNGFPGTVGTTFSRNGELQITATTTEATLVDTGVEINATGCFINFKVEVVDTDVQLYYMHNFPGALTFSTGTIIWLSI